MVIGIGHMGGIGLALAAASLLRDVGVPVTVTQDEPIAMGPPEEPVRIPSPEERREARKKRWAEEAARKKQEFLAWRDNGGKAAARRRRQMERLASRTDTSNGVSA